MSVAREIEEAKAELRAAIDGALAGRPPEFEAREARLFEAFPSRKPQIDHEELRREADRLIARLTETTRELEALRDGASQDTSGSSGRGER